MQCSVLSRLDSIASVTTIIGLEQKSLPNSATHPSTPLRKFIGDSRKEVSSCQPMHIFTNSSLPTPPFPSKSNSSIIATNSSSSKPSPSSLATLLKSSKLMIPLSSVSNRANALRISSLGSRSLINLAAIVWKACSVSTSRPGGNCSFCCCCVRGCLMFAGGRPASSVFRGGLPWKFSRSRICGFGRSKPSALRATLNSW
jgi:hypothetical protein